MTNFIENKCRLCGLLSIVSSRMLCYYCEKGCSNGQKLNKQDEIKKFLDDHKYHYISSDKIIDNGVCLKYRPDFLFDCETHHVVLEVDEEQHRSYEKECENIRMRNIVESLAMPIIFVRYNPDSYKNSKGKREDPCRRKRYAVLEKVLNETMGGEAFEKIRDEKIYLGVVYIYYDGYSEENLQILKRGV